MARPEAKAPFLATVMGVEVSELCLQPDTQRPPHLVTATAGSHQLESTLRYAGALNVAPFNSPFRPNRVGTVPVRQVVITKDDILVITDLGTIRLPPEITPYSYRV